MAVPARRRMTSGPPENDSGNRSSSSSSNNVSVVCRLRPIVPHETEHGCKKAVHKVRTIESVLNGATQDEEVVRVEVAKNPNLKASNNHELVKCFALDAIFEEQDSQEDVYEKSGARKAVSQDLFRGFHCTILAYGQSGSGKTYTMGTMSGSPDERGGNEEEDSLDPEVGVIQRACHDLFRQVEEQCMGEATVEVSYLEIYNEEIRDLLSDETSKVSHFDALQHQQRLAQHASAFGQSFLHMDGNQSGDLTIREHANGEVFVQGKVSIPVTSARQVCELMRLANTKRVVASTKLNEVSSRSHAICILTVTGTNSFDVTFQSRLTLVDLAGSERLAKTENSGWRAKEGININSGLFVLGLVISALTETRPQHKRHPPYRESKLTRMLQNSLGGNARTIMIACCSPTDYHADETVNTLRYATKARSIENPAVANIIHDEHAEQVLKLQSQNDQLQQTNGTLQEQISEYEVLIRQISDELRNVKRKYQSNTQELSEVKGEYETTSKQLLEIQREFQVTVDTMKMEKIENVLKKQNRRQKRGSDFYLHESLYGDDDQSDLLHDPNITPARSISPTLLSYDNSIGTEPTADLTIATGANNSSSPADRRGNRIVPPPILNTNLLGDSDGEESRDRKKYDAVSLVNESQQDDADESLHSLSDTPATYAEEEKKEGDHQDADQDCVASYQKCATSTSQLYCRDSLVDKVNEEDEVMVEAFPVSMPYGDLTGVMNSRGGGYSSPNMKMVSDDRSLQSGTITQGSQATGGSPGGKRKTTGFKRFLSNFNCMSGNYGMVAHRSRPPRGTRGSS